MSKYLNRDEPGREAKNKKARLPRQTVKNLYCPKDGHYCEQPNCENCMFETVGDNNG